MPVTKGDNIIYTGADLEGYILNFSSKLSDIVRQLALAGIAIDWIFLFNSKSEQYNYCWLIPLAFFVVAVAVDALYYFRRVSAYQAELAKEVIIDEYPISFERENARNRIQHWRNWLTLIGYFILIGMICFTIFSPIKVLMKGVVVDASSGKPIPALIAYENTGKVNSTKQISADTSGLFTIILDNTDDYELLITADNYYAEKQFFSMDSVRNAGVKKVRKQFYLVLNKKDSVEVLNNVLFEFGKAELRGNFADILNSTLVKLQANPKVIARVNGHTDDKGTPHFNEKLSFARANAVCEYFKNRGVNGSRLIAIGFGEMKPVATNDTEEGCQLNRRVEVEYLWLK